MFERQNANLQNQGQSILPKKRSMGNDEDSLKDRSHGSTENRLANRGKVDSGPIESLLSVPGRIVFFQTGGKPLLTLAEGHCMLRIRFLAQEMDSLLFLAEELLVQRRACRIARGNLDDVNNPLLRPLSIVVSILESQSAPGLQCVQAALSGLLSELASSATILRQSAQQNWSVSDSLLEVTGGLTSHALARNKRRLAELEEEISSRIDGVIKTATITSSTPKARKAIDEPRRKLFESEGNPEDMGNEPLSAFCDGIFLQEVAASELRGSMRPLQALTQPKDYGSSSSRQCLDFDGSQNSFGQKASAAETLANMAVGNVDSSSTDNPSH